MTRILLCATLLAFAATTCAQNQYWAQQYGAQSALLGGAVVAGATDNSALYYNPSLLARIENGHLSVSANAYGFEIANLKNGAGNGLDLNSFQTLIYPQMISGMIKLKKAPRWKLAYGLLTRFHNRLKLSLLTEQHIEITTLGDGPEFYRTNFEYELRNIEQWGAIGFGFKVTEGFSIGLTQFISYLNNESRLYIDRSVDVSDDFNSFTAQQISAISDIINHVGLLYKLGLSYHHKRHKIGLSATSTNVRIFGQANASASQIENNMDKIGAAAEVPFFAFESFIVEAQNRNLRAAYRLPWSFALGYEYRSEKGTRIMISSELFLPVKRYTVYLDQEPSAIRPAQLYNSAEVDSFLFKSNELSRVINAGIALEHPISEKFSYLFSFRTDFNSVDFDSERNVQASINTTFWNAYHFSTGLTWERRNSKLAFGFNYTLGESKAQRQPISFSSPISLRSFVGAPERNFSPVVHGFAVIFGYTFYLPK